MTDDGNGLPGLGICIVKIRRSPERLIFITGILLYWENDIFILRRATDSQMQENFIYCK